MFLKSHLKCGGISSSTVAVRESPVQLGLRENAGQFSLLVLVNAFVGAMVGMERSILPMIGEGEFALKARTAILSFIVVFGLTKAVANYFAGRLSDDFGRKHILIAGWLIAVPVPFLLMWAPSWNWILFANALLGASQGLSWSATVIMKIDLVGDKRRGLAMGLNEFAGYIAVAVSSLATGFIAADYGLRPEPFYIGVGFVAFGLLLSIFLVRETRTHHPAPAPSSYEIFRETTFHDRNLSSVSQVGFVNNLNDALTWGVFPFLFARAGMTIQEIGVLAAVCPAIWGIAQLGTGPLSDKVGRKRLIVAGMWIQSGGIAWVIISSEFLGFFVGVALLGFGTAMVYPTLMAAVGDVVHPSRRASSVGVYRMWRDLGYVAGALLVGLAADSLGIAAAIWIVATLTFLSGVAAALRMTETLHSKHPFLEKGSKSVWLYPAR
jgi:MFS family permease